MRLFFLSLLWRAAATDRPEFNEIDLPLEHLEQLRLMVLNGNPEPIEFYAVSLIQLSTIGEKHNQSPFAFTKTMPSVGKEDSIIEEPVFRFYLDGLIIHYSRLCTEQNKARKRGEFIVGAEDTIKLSTVEFEHSAQTENLAILRIEAELGRRSLK